MRSAPEPPRCPECGAHYRMAGDRCWLCGGALSSPADSRPQASSAAVDSVAVQGQTSLASTTTMVVLTATLVVISVGVFSTAPGLGFLLLCIAVPALAFAIVTSSRAQPPATMLASPSVTTSVGSATPTEGSPRRSRHLAASGGSTIGRVVESVAMAVLLIAGVVVSLFIAIFLTCTGGLIGAVASDARGDSSTRLLVLGAIAGGIAGLAIIGTVVWLVLQAIKSRRGSA